jgi:hypothetical protein
VRYATLIAALLAPCAGAAVAASATSVSSLHTFRRAVRVQTRKALPAPVADQINALEQAHIKVGPVSLALTSGQLRLFEYTAAPDGTHPHVGFDAARLCYGLLRGQSYSVSCAAQLRDASGQLNINEGLLAGKPFLFGLTGNAVTGVTLQSMGGTPAGSAPVKATVGANGFILPLPGGGGHGIGAVSLAVQLSGGAVVNATVSAWQPGTPG